MQMIIFNGIQYSNPDEMPPEVRQAYEQAMGVLADRDGNGMPDILEQALSGKIDPADIHITQRNSTFVFNGQTYSSPEQLPREVRQRYEQARAAMDAKQNGMPDVLEKFLPATPSQPSAQIPVQSSQPISYSSIEPEGVNLRGLLTGAAIAVFVMLVIGAALVFSGLIRLP